jgi:hypothetical protein
VVRAGGMTTKEVEKESLKFYSVLMIRDMVANLRTKRSLF